VEKLKLRIIDKVCLILIKFFLHFVGLSYAISTLLQFVGYDMTFIGYFIHVSIFVWIMLIAVSILLRFCYVHRLPLYYVLINDSLIVHDFYFTNSLSTNKLLAEHLLIIFAFIMGYTYYYVKRRC